MQTQVIDQYHGDPIYAHLQSVIRDVPAAQEILKTASFDKEAAETLPSSAFAWEDLRRFPVHTKADAVASILYRSKIASYVPVEVDARLATAAKIYGLALQDFQGTKTAAQTEPTYALPEIKRLPLDSELQIKTAEEVLCRDFRKLPLEMRADAFSRLIKEAADRNMELSPLAYKLGGLTVCDTKQLREWLEARVEASQDERYKIAFQTLADGLKPADAELTNRKDLVKLASTIYGLDVDAGLEKYYDKKLPDALLSVFNTEKVAEDMCDVAGKKVACSKLMNLPNHIWEQIDVPELSKIAQAGNLQEFRQVFDTLPVDLKMALRSYV